MKTTGMLSPTAIRAGVLFCDAGFSGLEGSVRLDQQVEGLVSGPCGGPWEVASPDRIFAIGCAPFFGSTGTLGLTRHLVGLAVTNDVGGWLIASDGGEIWFGDARYCGSQSGAHLSQPMWA